MLKIGTGKQRLIRINAFNTNKTTLNKKYSRYISKKILEWEY